MFWPRDCDRPKSDVARDRAENKALGAEHLQIQDNSTFSTTKPLSQSLHGETNAKI